METYDKSKEIKVEGQNLKEKSLYNQLLQKPKLKQHLYSWGWKLKKRLYR